MQPQAKPLEPRTGGAQPRIDGAERDGERLGEACYRLAGLYAKGAGVYRDTSEASGYTRLACEHGHAEACPKPKAPPAPAQTQAAPQTRGTT